MKNLLFTLLAMASFTAFIQYTPDEGSFTVTYSQLRSYEKPEGQSDWVYANGDFHTWTFQFNVDFFACPGCREQFGTVMEDSQGKPKFFMNYLGGVIEGEDEYGKYNSFMVDILSKDDETGKWKWWETGECRHYGKWTMLYLKNPAILRFDYFNKVQ